MNERMDIRDNLSAYLDGELNADERARLEQALRGSEELRRELDALAATRDLLRNAPRASAPADFRQRVLGEARRRTAPLGAPAGGTDPARTPKTDTARRHPWLGAMAIAASMLLAAGAGFLAVRLAVRVPPAPEPPISQTHERDELARDLATRHTPPHGPWVQDRPMAPGPDVDESHPEFADRRIAEPAKNGVVVGTQADLDESLVFIEEMDGLPMQMGAAPAAMMLRNAEVNGFDFVAVQNMEIPVVVGLDVASRQVEAVLRSNGLALARVPGPVDMPGRRGETHSRAGWGAERATNGRAGWEQAESNYYYNYRPASNQSEYIVFVEPELARQVQEQIEDVQRQQVRLQSHLNDSMMVMQQSALPSERQQAENVQRLRAPTGQEGPWDEQEQPESRVDEATSHAPAQATPGSPTPPSAAPTAGGEAASRAELPTRGTRMQEMAPQQNLVAPPEFIQEQIQMDRQRQSAGANVQLLRIVLTEGPEAQELQQQMRSLNMMPYSYQEPPARAGDEASADAEPSPAQPPAQ